LQIIGSEPNNGVVLEFGAIFSTLALSSIIYASNYRNYCRQMDECRKAIWHSSYFSGLALLYIPQVDDPDTFYYVIFGAMICYMPTISLSNSVGLYHS
jgi:NHS family xanthosine MFS transporter